MKISNEFRVDASATDAWALLKDVPEVVPCMPGAELVEVVGEDAWKARLKTKLGAMSFVFDADVSRESCDDAARTIVLVANANDNSGRGQAKARISSSLAEAEGLTVGSIETEITLAGNIARFGRQGLVEDVSAQLIKQFAANLEAKLKAGTGSGGSGAGASQGPPGAPRRSGSSPQAGEASPPGSPDSGPGSEVHMAPAPAADAPPLRALPLLARAIGHGIGRRLAALWAAIRRLFGGGNGARSEG